MRTNANPHGSKVCCVRVQTLKNKICVKFIPRALQVVPKRCPNHAPGPRRRRGALRRSPRPRPGRPRGEQTLCLCIEIDTPPGDAGDGWYTSAPAQPPAPILTTNSVKSY